MEENWVKVETYVSVIDAEIVKQMLVENEIPAVVVNKQDVFVRFGQIELFVPNDLVDNAVLLINQKINK